MFVFTASCDLHLIAISSGLGVDPRLPARERGASEVHRGHRSLLTFADLLRTWDEHLHPVFRAAGR